MSPRISILTIITALSLSQYAVAQSKDTVYRTQGSSIRGTILGMTHDSVKLDGAALSSIPANEIARIIYSDEPSMLRSARQSIRSSNWEDAQKKLSKIDVSTVTRNIISHEIEYYQALCDAKQALSGIGDQLAAARSMNAFLSKNTNSYHYYEASKIMGDLAVTLGRFDNALTFYRRISKAPWPEQKLQSYVLEGRTLLLQESYSKALTAFEKVLTDPSSSASAEMQKTLAMLGKAVCLAAGNQPKQGIALVEKIIAAKDSQNQEIFSHAYNALGRCYLKAGNSQEALLAYLHVDLLYSSNSTAHAESLYYLSKLWPQVNQPGKSLQARNSLKTDYPNSYWANRND